MKSRKFKDRWVVRLEKGEELIATLTEFARLEGIGGGTLSGIGAVRDVTLGYFDVKRGEYARTSIPDEVELLSLAGNISFLEGRPFVHGHAVVAGGDFVPRGGHLFSATVTVTAEIMIGDLGKDLIRRRDPGAGFNPLDP